YTHAYACSDAAGKWLFKKRPFEICPNAIDTEMYSYRGDAKNDTVVFGMVGGITEVKNHIFALDVLPDDCELMIIGDGPLAPELKAKTTDRHNIHWMGQRNDVHELIQHMDALLLPSLHEGLPTVVLEAQCAGLPVFCADTVSTMCAFTDKVTFLPLDKEEWRHALDAFTPIDRAENAEIAIAAMKAAGYDLRIAAQRMQETYLKLSPDGGKSNCQN
ncbi:MAG: glycosyltransferase, partial [Clostridia bacterium]|nr:glycosyltransferase [Clostridia bacterium]